MRNIPKMNVLTRFIHWFGGHEWEYVGKARNLVDGELECYVDCYRCSLCGRNKRIKR